MSTDVLSFAHTSPTEQAHSEEEENFTKDNIGAEAEYIDDNEEWDEQDHDEDAPGETDPEAAAEDRCQIDATRPTPTVEPEAADVINPLLFVKGKTAHPDESTAPLRKRSFSEVEVEPEDDLKHCASFLDNIYYCFTDMCSSSEFEEASPRLAVLHQGYSSMADNRCVLFSTALFRLARLSLLITDDIQHDGVFQDHCLDNAAFSIGKGQAK
jgi:hypothetical protein